MTGSTAAAHGAVSYLLGSPVLRGRCRPMVAGGEFDWPALLAEAEAMSGGERILVHVAHDLWEAGDGVRMWELARGLDRANFERVVTALRIYRGGDGAASHAGLSKAA